MFQISWNHGNFGNGAFFFALNKIFIILRKLICGIIMRLVRFYIIRHGWLLIESWNCFIFFVVLLFRFRKHVDDRWILYKSSSFYLTKLVLLMLSMTYFVVQKVSDFFFIFTLKRIMNIIDSIWNLLQNAFQLLFYFNDHFINLYYFVIY